MAENEPRPATDDEVRAALAGAFDAARTREAGRSVWAVRCCRCHAAWVLPAPTDAELAELREHSAGHQRVTT